MLPALLLGLAAGLLLLPAPQHRLRRLAGKEVATEGADPESVRRLSCVVLGLVVGFVVGLPVGAPLGLAVAVLGPRAMAKADRRLERAEQELAQQLPLALDLLAACLAGGAGMASSLQSVSQSSGGVVGERLRRVAMALSVGTPPTDAFRELGTAGAGGAAARSLCRASEGGTPVAGAVAAVAEEARRRARLVARKRARRAGTLATGPLTLCFLPAFLVLGIVPCFVGVAGPLVSSL
ncbi:MAG TPA: type II secretion system F family protein [Mycobacteriales bacterium]|nr:type II secretion system F family protein [Mycobacteriales bacterium]